MLLLILRRNGVYLVYTQDELVALGLAVAQGDADLENVQNWIEQHKAEE